MFWHNQDNKEAEYGTAVPMDQGHGNTWQKISSEVSDRLKIAVYLMKWI
jgi:uncharacterized protein YaaW (UPF0174 family)